MATLSSQNSFGTSFMGTDFAEGLPPCQHGTIPRIASASGHARQLNGNIITNNTIAPPDSSMSHMLWQAAYDSNGNQDQDYCYKGTRVDLLDKILSEIKSHGSGGLIWLTGPAGFGKSAIAKSICLALDHTKRKRVDFESSSHEFQLGASYFFRRADTERSNVNKMIFTIAQQLSDNIDGFRSQTEYQEQKTAQMESHTLFENIVEKPLKKLSRRRIAIVIDALDECTTSWETIVDMFSQLRDLPDSSACVRIVFTSRPQPRIQYVFQSLQTKLTVDLDDEDIVQSSQEDISIFLQEQFKDIHNRALHSSTQAIAADCIKIEWPSEVDFARAVSLATTPKPLFIYAVTMCRFIGFDNADPRNRLQQWLGANRETISPMTMSSSTQYQLFSMYRIFFHEVESCGLIDAELDQLRSILHGVLVVGNNLPMKGLLQLLGYVRPDRREDDAEPEELFLLRRNFRPILDIPEDMDQNLVLKVYHKSLTDFLEQARPVGSKFYPFNTKRSGLDFGTASLVFLSNILSQNLDEVDECATRVAKYAFHHWPSFLLQGADEIDDKTLKLVTEFLQHDFLASFTFSQSLFDAKDLSDALYHLSKQQNSLLLKDAAALLREISSLDFIKRAGHLDRCITRMLQQEISTSFRISQRIQNARDFGDSLYQLSKQRDSEDLKELATIVSELGYQHFLHNAGAADDYSSAFCFCPPTSSLIENAQWWYKPRARCQTSSLREPLMPKAWLIPRSAHFSRDSTVFVAMCSQQQIHCWARARAPHTTVDSPDNLGWVPIHVPIYESLPAACGDMFIFKLSAAGNTMAYNTLKGIEVWGTETGNNRRLQHPPGFISWTKLKALALSEDGKYLAACYYHPTEPGCALVWVWTVADVCAARGFSSTGLGTPLEHRRRMQKMLLSSSSLISRALPSNSISFSLNFDRNVAGMTFSQTGDRLAILTFSHVAQGDKKFVKTNGVSDLAVHTWDTTTWKPLPSICRSRQTPSPARPHDDAGTKCLNCTFSSSNEIAILWQFHIRSSNEYFHSVEFLDLAQTDDVESVVVDLPFNALSEVCLDPDPFWVEGDKIHVSHGYFRISRRNGKVVESLCFFKNFKYSDESLFFDQPLYASRPLYVRSGISHNDQRFLWIPWDYSDHTLFVCGRHTFVLSEGGSGNVTFIEMAKTEE